MKKKVVVMLLVVGYFLSHSAEAQKAQSANSPSPAAPAVTKPESIATIQTLPSQAAPAPVVATTQGGFARLSLRSQPDSAAIVIDSLDKGQTPARFDSLSPGQHTILIKKKGYFVKKITTTLSPDSLHDISVVLVRPGCIVVKSDPPGATLFFDNKAVGTTPYENAKLKPGNYALKLELAQHETIERPITVAETGCDTLSFSLSLSKAYTDSVERAQKAANEKKSKFKKTVNLIAVGAFLVFGVIILFIEAGNAD